MVLWWHLPQHEARRHPFRREKVAECYINLIHESLTLQPCAGDPRWYGHLAIRWLQRCLRWEDGERQRVYTMGMGGIQPGLRQCIQSWIGDVAGLAGLEFSRVLSFCQFCPAKTHELLTAIGSSFHLESESWRFYLPRPSRYSIFFVAAGHPWAATSHEHLPLSTAALFSCQWLCARDLWWLEAAPGPGGWGALLETFSGRKSQMWKHTSWCNAYIPDIQKCKDTI